MPHTFTDNKGRSWSIEINSETIGRVKKLIDLNLADPVAACTKLAKDPEQLVNCFFCLCLPQADAAGVTDEDFGTALGGDAIEHAAQAFVDALRDYFPKFKRNVFARVADKVRRLVRA